MYMDPMHGQVIFTSHIFKMGAKTAIYSTLIASIYFKYYQGKVGFSEFIKRMTEHSINTKTKIPGFIK